MHQDITAKEVKQRLDNGEKLFIIDVREPYEYEEYNIGGKLIPLGELQTQIDDLLENHKDEEIIIHCRSGARSTAARNFMIQNGFNNIRNMVGGIMAYQVLE